jgi:hypothetical protein
MWPSGGMSTIAPSDTLTDTLWNAQVRDAVNLLATYVDTTTGKPSWFRIARQTADVTKNNSTTLADLTGLSFAIGASETWGFVAMLHGTSGTTPIAKFGVTVPASATGRIAAMPSYLTVCSAALSGTVAPYTHNFAEGLLVYGSVVNSTTAGTVQVQFAQNTAEASNSVMYAGGILLAFRLI